MFESEIIESKAMETAQLLHVLAQTLEDNHRLGKKVYELKENKKISGMAESKMKHHLIL